MSFNTFDMSDMTNIQNDWIEDSEIEVNLTESFEPYYGYYGHVNFGTISNETSVTTFGLLLDYSSTGGRVSRADYSGSLYLDILAKSYAIGTTVRHMISKNKKYSLGFETGISVSFSNMDIKSKYEIYDEHATEELLAFKSNSLQLRLLIINKFQIVKSLFIINKIGLLADMIKGRLESEDFDGAYLETPSGSEANLDWTGLRLSLGIGVHIH